MSSQALTEVTGFAELQRKLMLIANDRRKRSEILKVLRKVASGTVRVARRNAPKSDKPHLISGSRTRRIIQPGNLRKSIGTITGRSENPTVYVGPRAKGNNLGFYGHFIEYGHNTYKKGFKRKRSSSAKALRHNMSGVKSRTEANPFMAETYNETKGQVTPETADAVAKVIQKTIDRLSI